MPLLTLDRSLLPATADQGMHGGVCADALFQHAYVGQGTSTHRKRPNLGHQAIVAGAASGTVQWSRDAPAALPEQANCLITVNDVARHPTLSVLFWVWEQSSPTGGGASYCDLSAAGVPGAPVAITTNLSGLIVHAVAFHPTGRMVYFAGRGTQGVSAVPLDLSTGHPTGAGAVFAYGTQGKVTASVNAAGDRLYVGTYPDSVEVYDLDVATGAILAGHLYTFPSALSSLGQDYARVHLGPHALYVRRNTGAGPFLAYWPLDINGYPTGAMTSLTGKVLAENQWNFGSTAQSRCIAAGEGAQANKLLLAEPWTVTDHYTSAVVTRGVSLNLYGLNNDGSLQASPTLVGQAWGKTCCRLALAATGDAVLLAGGLTVNPAAPGNLDGELKVRFTVTATVGGPTPAFPQTFGLVQRWGPHVGVAEVPVSITGLNVASAWVPLDPWLKDAQTDRAHNGFTFRQVTAVPYYTGLTVKIELADVGGTILETVTDTVSGTEIDFAVVGNASGPLSTRLPRMRLWSAVMADYRALADTYAVPPTSRPKRFACSLAQVHVPSLHPQMLADAMQIVADLGANACNLRQSFPQNFPAGVVQAAAAAKGVTSRHSSFFSPLNPESPTYFSFLTHMADPSYQDAWSGPWLATEQAMQDQLATAWPDLGASDEPNWNPISATITLVRTTPAYLLLFQQWVQSTFGPRGKTPASFVSGATLWTDAGLRPILPSEEAAAPTAPNRLLLYATIRYLAWSFSKGFDLVRQSLQRVAGAPLKVSVNWNNFGNSIYTPAAADAGIISPSWYDAARLGAHHPLTETWLTSWQTEVWDTRCSMLRYLAKMNPLGFHPGVYLVGTPLSGLVGVGKAFLLPALAAGVKFFNWYGFGPDPLLTTVYWSEQPYLYREIAAAHTFLACCEDHLADATPGYGNVAILTPEEGRVWDADGTARLYHDAPGFLASLFQHQGYSVDLLDQDEIAAGALSRYAALAITSPNIRQDVQDLIAAWVPTGKVLLGTAGAGVADEANTPTETLTSLFGLSSGRTADRTATIGGGSYSSAVALDTVVIGSDPNYGAAGATYRTVGLKAPLSLAGAVAKATFSVGGGVAIAEHAVGAGRAISYGGYPGMDHWCSPTRPHDLGSYTANQFYARDWDPVVQRAGVGGLIAAGVPKLYTVDRPSIPVSLQPGPGGLSLVVQNWSGVPQANVVLTIPLPAAPASVRSVVGATLGPYANGAATITIPTLAEGDVLHLPTHTDRPPGVTTSTWSLGRTSHP